MTAAPSLLLVGAEREGSREVEAGRGRWVEAGRGRTGWRKLTGVEVEVKKETWQLFFIEREGKRERERSRERERERERKRDASI